jgi:hypothetical protein
VILLSILWLLAVVEEEEKISVVGPLLVEVVEVVVPEDIDLL